MARTLPMIDAGSAGTPPPFARVGIVGLGLVGGSVALAARRAWPSVLVVGVDRNDVLEDAQRAHAIDVGADDLGMIAEVDLVVLAAPVKENARILPQLPDVIPAAVVVTDVGSAKQVMVDAARGLPGRMVFIGGHPLAGARQRGISHASPDLFKGRPWILTPAEPDAAAEALARLEQFTRGIGAVPRVMPAADHDAAVARIGQLSTVTPGALAGVDPVLLAELFDRATARPEPPATAGDD